MFDPLLAYGVSLCGILLLCSMAHKNRRSGWERERHDLPMEILLRWAAERAKAYESQDSVPMPRRVDATPALTTSLLALQETVGTAQTPVVADGPEAATIAAEEKVLKSQGSVR
jgi:hypothetical protein